VTIAADAGLDAVLIRRLLATDADAETIRSRAAHARERGVTSVPTFILDNTHVITGAQPAKLWMQVIDEIAAT
jgi:predicted DsbA family dithiol-disulfide isomerase